MYVNDVRLHRKYRSVQKRCFDCSYFLSALHDVMFCVYETKLLK